MAYARGTSVSGRQSRQEIEAMVLKHGATAFGSITDEDRMVVAFSISGRKIRVSIQLPKPDEFRETATRRRRTKTQMEDMARQRTNELWRAMLLTIKAKFESVESGIELFDEAWMPHIVMPGGQTIGEQVLPNIERAYALGRPIPLLEAPEGHS